MNECDVDCQLPSSHSLVRTIIIIFLNTEEKRAVAWKTDVLPVWFRPGVVKSDTTEKETFLCILSTLSIMKS